MSAGPAVHHLNGQRRNSMPFDFKNRDRIGNLIRELAEYRYRDMRDITEFSWQNDDGSIGNRMPQGDPETVGLGFRWKGWDQYNWLSANRAAGMGRTGGYRPL